MCDVKKLHIHKKCSTPMEPSIVFLQIENESIGLCDRCWSKVANSDLEWGNSPKLTIEEILSDKARFGENPVETEYKWRGVVKEAETKEDEELEGT